MKRILLLLAVFVLVPQVEGWAGSQTFQHDGVNDYNNCEDDGYKYTINNADSMRNYGAGAVSDVGTDVSGEAIYRQIVRFPSFSQVLDDSGVTAAEIDSGEVEFYFYGESDAADTEYVAYQVDNLWEHGVQGTAQYDSNVCWIYRKDSLEAGRTGDTAWGTPGGDYTTVCDTVEITSATGEWWGWKIPKTVCSSWVADSLQNYGIILKSLEEDTTGATSTYKYARSSHYVTTGERPRFTVYWTHSGTAMTIGPATIGTGVTIGP